MPLTGIQSGWSSARQASVAPLAPQSTSLRPTRSCSPWLRERRTLSLTALPTPPKPLRPTHPSAAIFSEDDLTINGSGSVAVSADHKNGIQSHDDLKVAGGNITVEAANDGLKGRDSIAIKGGTITVNAGGDGLQSNNDEDGEKGYVVIDGGTLRIIAGGDGIQAETVLSIGDADVTVTSGGGSAAKALSTSAKGLKAGAGLTMADGDIEINSADDSVHSNGTIAVAGGQIRLASGDDGMHADSEITISGGDIDIKKSYEGIEAAAITINDGTIHIISSDDGINVVGGMDGSSIGGRPGQNAFASSGSNYLEINGAYIAIDANGDGVDVNGPITMTGGTVIINGPTRNDNGAFDYTGGFHLTGGFLLAVGSAGMAQAPSASSTQYSVMVNLTADMPAGTMVHIETTSHADVLTFLPAKAFRSVVLSSTELKKGETYQVYTGGSSTAAATDGLYAGGAYTAGTQSASFVISSMVTQVGSGGGFFPGGGRR